MTPQEYEKFAEALQENGYRKYHATLTNEDFYWCKGFLHQEDEDGDKRSSYQVLISENRRTDLVRCHETGDNIKQNETIAQSFYEWAKKNLEL